MSRASSGKSSNNGSNEVELIVTDPLKVCPFRLSTSVIADTAVATTRSLTYPNISYPSPLSLGAIGYFAKELLRESLVVGLGLPTEHLDQAEYDEHDADDKQDETGKVDEKVDKVPPQNYAEDDEG